MTGASSSSVQSLSDDPDVCNCMAETLPDGTCSECRKPAPRQSMFGPVKS